MILLFIPLPNKIDWLPLYTVYNILHNMFQNIYKVSNYSRALFAVFTNWDCLSFRLLKNKNEENEAQNSKKLRIKKGWSGNTFFYRESSDEDHFFEIGRMHADEEQKWTAGTHGKKSRESQCEIRSKTDMIFLRTKLSKVQMLTFQKQQNQLKNRWINFPISTLNKMNLVNYSLKSLKKLKTTFKLSKQAL